MCIYIYIYIYISLSLSLFLYIYIYNISIYTHKHTHTHTHLHTHTGYTRAAPGGVGGVKAVGNYVPSLKPQKEAKEDGFDNVIFLDSETGTYIEEVRAREEERQCACMHACMHPSIHPSIYT